MACLLYEQFSQPKNEESHRICTPYLIFVLNFDEIEYKALEMDMQWLEAFDRRPPRQPIKLKMLGAKDLTKRGDLYLKGKFEYS